MTSKRWVLWVTLAAAGCSARLGLGETVPQAFDPLCGAPRQAIVAETDASSALVRLATDTLAEGLSALGFQVLAPRRAFPASNRREVNDWIFSSQVVETDEGRVEVNVEVRSLLENRRVWAIADALSELHPPDPSHAVTQGVGTALAMFENDLLGCRAAER